VDVNLNRLTEGLRVVEDVVRLGLEDRRLLSSVRTLRTQIGRKTRLLRKRFVLSRKSETDLGRGDRFDRTRRRSLEDVLAANLKRAQESCRVLEEMVKVVEPKLAGVFKEARFRLYDIERQVAAALSDRGRRGQIRRQKSEGRSQNEGRP
jgi:thiamine-phosphate pyrophosphorylase